MTIKFYGTRGSLPICQYDYMEYGGNTTCVAIYDKTGDSILIFDAGTGIRRLGKEIMTNDYLRKKKIVILFSHFHWDHIQGFPFFDPAYVPDMDITIGMIGTKMSINELKDILSTQMGSKYFPVQLDRMGANTIFDTKTSNEVIFPGGRIISNFHSHPGGAYGYRLESEDKCVVFCTDVEHGDNIDPKVVELARNADVLIHEAQYTPEELPRFKGWGHSSWAQAIEVARQANAESLYLTHHDPNHDDDFLHKVERQCQKEFKKCFLAREGMEISI